MGGGTKMVGTLISTVQLMVVKVELLATLSPTILVLVMIATLLVMKHEAVVEEENTKLPQKNNNKALSCG